MARVDELKEEVARLNTVLAEERSWGSAMVVDVIKVGYRLLGEALAAAPADRAKVVQVRDLLGRNGATD
jgi:hypothetical protein